MRESEAAVTMGFPGRWRWRQVVAAPDRYAWTIHTTGAPLHQLFDGRIMRSFVGPTLAAEDASPDAPLRSHARFMAVLQLDALAGPGVHVREVAPAERLPGARHGLEAVFADAGDRYRVGLDRRGLVVAVEGPVDLPPLGRRSVRVVLGDWRRVRGYRLPHRGSWTADGAPLAEERAVRLCPLPAGLPAAAFARPDALPSCP